MKTDLAIDEAHILHLVRSFLSAVEKLHLSGDEAGHAHVGVVEVQAIAKVTQGFVDFGNIVSIFVPELFHQTSESAEEGLETIKALAESVSDAASNHADTAAALAARILGHIKNSPKQASHLQHAHKAAYDIEKYWREVSKEFQDVPNRLNDADRYVSLRALSPIWHRIAKKVCHAQEVVGAALSIPTATPLRSVANNKNIGSDR